ncbi:MAG: hypothetical protein ACE366_14905 [Bradymonadia bacterium]
MGSATATKPAPTAAARVAPAQRARPAWPRRIVSGGVCSGGTCAAPACDDGVGNGDETDVDCGGSCAPCPSGLRCAAA